MTQDRSVDHELLAAALRGHRPVRELIDRLTPVIQARVARSLLRWRQANPRAVRDEVEDLVQEVFVVLFEGDARVLRAWQPERGLSLENFVGLVAERQTVSILRTAKRNPWREEPTPVEELDERSGEPDPEVTVTSRDGLRRLLARLREELSPSGWQLFDLLYIQDKSVTEAGRVTARSSGAIYAWRNRLKRLAVQLAVETMPDANPSQRLASQEGVR